MEMKEFYYKNGIRISIFNLDNTNVPCHIHSEVSDIILCTKGGIKIDLPDLKKIIKIEKGRGFQIPNAIRHRFINLYSEQESQYVLLQIGDFDINFMQDERIINQLVQDAQIFYSKNCNIYIKNRKRELIKLSNEFSANTPKSLTQDECNNVIFALQFFASNGLETDYVDTLSYIK